MVGGDWRLGVGGWRRLAAVCGWRLVVGGDWWLAVGSWWRLAAVGGWQVVPVTMYGTTHAHLVHMCWPLLWALKYPYNPPPQGGDCHLATVPPPWAGDRRTPWG